MALDLEELVVVSMDSVVRMLNFDPLIVEVMSLVSRRDNVRKAEWFCPYTNRCKVASHVGKRGGLCQVTC